jgi:IS1 family transposase
MLFLKIEEKQRYIWTCHEETTSGFILIIMGFQKFKHRHAKLAVDFGNSIDRFKPQQ